jgi:hypothetical protein
MTSPDKMQLERLIRPWGRTSERVSQEIGTQVYDWNLPAPFETVPERPSIYTVEERLREICDRNTQKSRKGMMNASWFRVVLNEEAKAVEVWHLNASNPDRLFIKV